MTHQQQRNEQNKKITQRNVGMHTFLCTYATHTHSKETQEAVLDTLQQNLPK